MAWVWSEDKPKVRSSSNRQKSPEIHSRKKTPEIKTKLENPESFPVPKDGRARKSERQEYDFMHTNNLTTLTAPFGTNDTPSISYKIIGSKPVHVIESVQPYTTQNSLNGTPRIQYLEGLTEKPNRQNERLLNEGAKNYYTAQQDQFSAYVQGKPTHTNPITERGRRPDSKNLSPYRSLPPIEANRDKNKKSTVFEREPWVRNSKDAKLATNTEYKAHYDPRPHSDQGPSPRSNGYGNGFDNQINGYRNDRSYTDYNNGYQDRDDMSNGPLQSLVAYLPPGHYLPSDPMNFDYKQRQLLLDVTADDLRNTTTDDIKSAYQILSRFDRSLSGWAPMDKVQDALRVCKAGPSDPALRCIASMYVDPKYQGSVNYEEIIKFLNEAISGNHNGVRNISMPREKETAMLLMRTGQQLGNQRIDMERLIQSFQTLDADRREMLAAIEIKNVLYDNRIQLQESLIDDILSKMEGSNRDGKYSWKRFVEFLERVQPTKTGLEIFYNKRPLEYAKQYPQPVDSWPRAKETPRMSPPPYHRRSISLPPLREKVSRRPSWRHYDLEPLSPRKDYGYSPPRAGLSPRRSYDNGPLPKYHRPGEDIWRKIDAIEAEIRELEAKNKGKEPLSSRAPGGEQPEVRNRIMRVEEQIKELEHRNQYLRQGLDSDTRGDSWEAKLIQLAGILYRMDEAKYKSTGRLFYDTIVEYSMNHNQYANMQIPDDVIYRLAQKHMNDRNMVDIARFMEDLGDKRTWFRK
ncbi:hypothetical protein FSP39_019313 [Pinctada imbricata]|uniref:EF-hand domain-containing protein n=1 Tax=Pinctada imbricata TaxID=66713 RepID=A0AA88XTA8_PINIB|nr:hypothetical protein FSP39_019313 [Pinctada imbricata]